MLLLKCICRVTFRYTAIYFFLFVQSQYGFRFVQIGPAGIGLFGRYQRWIYVTTACAPISYCSLSTDIPAPSVGPAVSLKNGKRLPFVIVSFCFL